MHITLSAVRQGEDPPRVIEGISEERSSSSDVSPPHHLKRIERMEQVIVDLVDNFPADGGEDSLRSLLEPHHAKQLRKACVKLKLNAQSRTAGTDNKSGYIDLLLKYHSDKIDGELVARTGPTKEPATQPERRVSQHDIFLLVNILFSPEFVDRVSEADRNQKRSTLDTHAVNERSHYWKDIPRAYSDDRNKHKGLVSAHGQYQGIYLPGASCRAHSTKLVDMWNKLTSRDTVALGKMKLSGHNEREFLSFCKGRIDILYLHDWLLVRPGQLSKVCGRIVQEAQMSILADYIESDYGSADKSPAPSTNDNKRYRSSPVERIADILEKEHKVEADERHSSYEAVPRASTAVQSALTTLKMMKGADAEDGLVMLAQQKVDVLVQRWMKEMDSMECIKKRSFV